MLNRAVVTAVSVLFAIQIHGQTPSPSGAPTTSSPPAGKSPAPSPSATPTTEQVINSLGEADLRAAVSLLKSNFTNPDAITDTELNRATLTGLLIRMPGGLMLLPGRQSAAAEGGGSFYSEIFEGHIGYLRPGELNGANLKELDKKLQEFGQKKVDAVILDLRVSGTGDFASAAEFAKRFCPKGRTLFSVRKPAAHQDRQFTTDRDPAFQ
jgi:hypothetical protein